MVKQTVSSPIKLVDYADATGLRGRNLNFLSDMNKEQLMALFRLAEMLEPYTRTGLNLMQGKTLCTLFFEPSTRTRLSTETAMNKLGGTVISESNPLQSSSAAKDESLWDTLRTISQYADILALRHYDDKRVFADLPAATIPVISCGYGHVTHPTQGLLDLYTVWRVKGRFEGLKVLITSPDLSRARSGQSFALGLAQLGADIIYASPKDLPTLPEILEKVKSYGVNVTEVFDPTPEEHDELIMQSDLVYLPGCRIPKGGAERDLYMLYKDTFYIGLEPFERAKKEQGKIIGLMHSLPRFAGEFDFNIDNTEFELYFKQVGFGLPLRMALIVSMVGI
ncbi:MAG: aspartate carbamoyltransferase [Clostridia bacterium]|nr:aspartate carbamoyltransferase [Clostridia bacterium]